MRIKFTKYKARPEAKEYVTGPDGEPLYRLYIDGYPVREGLTLDDVIRAINRRDEKKLQEEKNG